MEAEAGVVRANYSRQTCYGPNGPLDQPVNAEPGRDVNAEAYANGEVLVNCQHIRDLGFCALALDKRCEVATLVMSAEERVYRAIAAANGEGIAMYQKQIALTLGINTTTVNRVLQAFRDRGVVREGGAIGKQAGQQRKALYIAVGYEGLFD